MSYSSTVPISDKRINEKDLSRLYEIFYQIYKESKVESKEIIIGLNFEGNERYQIENKTFNQVSDLLSTRVVDKINLRVRLYSYKTHKSNTIELNIIKGSSAWNTSDYSISSEDESWLTNKKNKIDKVLLSIEPQNIYAKRLKPWIFHFLRLTLGYIFLLGLVYFLNKSGYKSDGNSNSDIYTFLLLKITESNLGKIIVYSLLSYGSGLFPASLIERKLNKLIEDAWPDVEFNFGPQHLRIAQKKRSAISWLVTALIIPSIFLIFGEFFL